MRPTSLASDGIPVFKPLTCSTVQQCGQVAKKSIVLASYIARAGGAVKALILARGSTFQADIQCLLAGSVLPSPTRHVVP